ncbi:MAG: hypothetical protein KC431_00055, partial [Myxococcales bacterium]|nr:hypothetical protein [Myxococcales bacterium]
TDPTDTTGPVEQCVDRDLGSSEQAFWSDQVGPANGNDIAGICNGDGDDFVMQWRAPSSQNYRAELFSELGAVLQLQDEAACNGIFLTCGSFDFPSVLEFPAEAGQVFTFVVEAPFGPDFFDFSVSPSGTTTSCPWGGIPSVPFTLSDDTSNGSFELGAPCGGAESPEHAYIFEVPVSGGYRFDTEGSAFDTVLYVLDSVCGGTALACNDDTIGLSSEVVLDLTAGQLVTVVVDGFGGDQGPYTLHGELIDDPPPPPPSCDGTALASQVPVGVTWNGAQTEDDSFMGCSGLVRERRFTWVAPAAGDFRFDFDGGEGAAAISVFPGGCEGPMMCDVGADPQATVITGLAAGQEVFVVTEWGAQAGAVNLTISDADAVMGCGDPLPPGVPTFASGATGGAGNDFTGTCSVNPSPERELWWTAPATGTYEISLEGSAYDTLLYVRDGGCDGPELGCNDDTETMFGIELWSTLVLDLQAGQTISIFVDGFNGSGSFQLAINQL